MALAAVGSLKKGHGNVQCRPCGFLPFHLPPLNPTGTSD